MSRNNTKSTNTGKPVPAISLCKKEINNLLKYYNCYLTPEDEVSRVILIDLDTDESLLLKGE